MEKHYLINADHLVEYLKKHPEQYLEKTNTFYLKEQKGTCKEATFGSYKEVSFIKTVFNLNKESSHILEHVLLHRDKGTNKIILHPEVFQVSQPYFSKVMKALLEKEILVKVTYEKKLIEGKLRRVVYLLNPYFVYPFNRATAPQVYEEWDNIEKK